MNGLARLLVFTFFVCESIFAQDKNFQILLKEQHHDLITESVYSEKNDLLFTTDFSGKILIRSARETNKSILFKEADGLMIQDLNLIKNDSVLLYKRLDTIYGLRIHDRKELFKRQLNVTQFNSNDFLILSYFVEKDNVYMIQIMNQNFESVYNFTFNKKIQDIAVTADLTQAAILSSPGYQNNEIEIYNINTYDLIDKYKLPDNLRVDALYFNEFNNNFEVLVYDKDEQKIFLYDLTHLIESKKPILEIGIEKSIIPNISIKKLNDKYVIVHYSQSEFSNPVFIWRNAKNSFFKSYNLSVSHVSITSKNLLVFKHLWQSNKEILHDIYSLDNFEIISKHSNSNNRFQYQAQFLSDNSWVVFQPNTLGSHSDFLKYFESGTFNNRFFKLNFTEYIEANYGFYTSKMAFFEQFSGKSLLYGYFTENSSEYSFIEYDFIKDRINKVDKTPDGFQNIVDYKSDSSSILFSQNNYYDNGYFEPSQFSLFQKGKVLKLEGKFKFGKLSKNSRYLLLISDSNELTLLDIQNNLSPVHKEQLPNASYSILNLTETSFALNIMNTSTSQSCNFKVKFYDLENNELTINEQECVTINSISIVNEKVAIVMNNNFLIINGEVALKNFSKKPQSVSFNNLADRFMVTYADDSVEIFETETIEKLGVMLHPDNKTHVFVKDNKHFFGNTNYDDYLIALSDDTFLEWDSIDKSYENPLEILSMFGKPNLQYAEALQKAIEFKQNTNDITVNNNQSLSTENDDNQSLYVLSIGVSDYEQSDYSLTYADKDALDMVKIFGTFNDQQNSAYLNKFYGKKFHLKHNDSLVKTVNGYYERYNSVGEFMPLNSEKYSWFSSNYEKFKFFDFNNNEILEVDLPYESSFHDIQYGITKDGSGFYTLNNQDLVTYNFNTGAISEEKLSEDLNLYQYLNLNENEWIYTTTNASILELNFINNQHVSTRKKVKVDLMQIPYQIKDEYDSHPCEYGCMATLESATKDGNNFIISVNYPKEYYLIHKQKSEYQFLKLPVVDDEIKQLIKIQFSNNGQHIMVINEQDNSHLYGIYDFNGTLVNSLQLQKPQFFHKQVDYLNGVFFHIDFEEPLLDEDVLHFENHELFNNHKASSFNQVYTQYLTNDQATKKQIENSVTDFFKNIKPQDQVLVFMAGHGVLDENNKYYYAPYNMDFNDVKRNGVSYDFIIDILSSLPSQRKLLLMDTCHSGNVYDEVSGSNQDGQRGSKVRKASASSSFKVSDVISTLYNNELSKSNLTVISASSGSDVAFEYKELGNGAFTHAFLKELKKQLQESMYGEPNWEKSVGLNQAFIDEVFKEVVRITNNKQTPDIREISTSSNLKVW